MCGNQEVTDPTNGSVDASSWTERGAFTGDAGLSRLSEGWMCTEVGSEELLCEMRCNLGKALELTDAEPTDVFKALIDVRGGGTVMDDASEGPVSPWQF